MIALRRRLRRRLRRHRLDVDAYRAELVRDPSPLSIQRLARAEARLGELEAVLEILGWHDVAYSAPSATYPKGIQ